MAGIMSRSVKLGLAALFLSLGSILPSPIGFVCAVLSCVLGFLAAQQGSKWWLVVPSVVIAVFAVLMYVGFHAT
jgi:hypothetical protein